MGELSVQRKVAPGAPWNTCGTGFPAGQANLLAKETDSKVGPTHGFS